jgi:cell division protein FtsI/penicillin-binding protein 2
MSRRTLLGALTLSAAVVASGALVFRHLRAPQSPVEAPPEPAAAAITSSRPTVPALAPPFALDLARVSVDDEGAAVPLGDGRTARLTLDPRLQRAVTAKLKQHALPEAAVVVLDPATGEILAYASQLEGGEPRDLCREATAPAASVFKIVTGTALVEHAGLGPDTRQCYAGGGDQRILASDLVADPLRDKWCTTLAGAMGRSTNTVFARLAQNHLDAASLERQAHALGFGEALPFDVETTPSALSVPSEPLAFARTAAGFWNSTLSPLHAAWLSGVVAHGGEAMRPFIVREVTGADGRSLYHAAPAVLRHPMKPDTAQAVTVMMEHTVSEGTSYRAFHDGAGKPFLRSIPVAGKTGTLNDPGGQRLNTWFTGFAPSRPVAGKRQVAIGVLVVNRPKWRIKANTLAREILEAAFETAPTAHEKPKPKAHQGRAARK